MNNWMMWVMIWVFLFCICGAINEEEKEKEEDDKELVCRDCDHKFDEVDGVNASLCEDEFNIACPNCGNDWIEKNIFNK